LAPAGARPRVYLGATADDDAGRGARILSVHSGSPADRAGLQPNDLLVSAGGRRVRSFNELAALLNSHNPGDRVSLELVRGAQAMRTEVILGMPPGLAPASPQSPPGMGPGAGPTESIPPPPPSEHTNPPGGVGGSVAGPVAPAPPSAPGSVQTQIEKLQRRMEALERRIQELERALAESRKDK
jgi:membrane-associated protease RseP (regulator of RpoE activity)